MLRKPGTAQMEAGGAPLGSLTFPPLLPVTGISAVCAAGPPLAEPGR